MFKSEKTEFETELCTNDEHVIGKMYKVLKIRNRRLTG